MDAPKLLKPITAHVINERAAYGPVDLKAFFNLPADDDSLYISASLVDGRPLPDGLIVTEDGQFTGIPARKTRGRYQVVVTVVNDEGSVEAKFDLTIKPAPAKKEDGAEFIDELKAQVWQALGQNLPIPELADILERAITPLDIYYLLERWGTLTIYDAYNLEPPGKKTALNLEGMNKQFFIYDRGSCLVSCPKDLFSHERTLEDGLQSARVMAREAFKRGWTMELVGFAKYSRAAWVELQLLADQNNKLAEVINYNPTTNDVKIVTTTLVTRMRGME